MLIELMLSLRFDLLNFDLASIKSFPRLPLDIKISSLHFFIYNVYIYDADLFYLVEDVPPEVLHRALDLFLCLIHPVADRVVPSDCVFLLLSL